VCLNNKYSVSVFQFLTFKMEEKSDEDEEEGERSDVVMEFSIREMEMLKVSIWACVSDVTCLSTRAHTPRFTTLFRCFPITFVEFQG